MSKVLENAFEEVKKTHILVRDPRNFEITDAFIFWTNFSGTPNKFGNTARTFNVAIPSEAVAPLKEMGIRVREADALELIDPATSETVTGKVYFVNVKVNMNSDYPPLVKLFSTYRGKKTQSILSTDEDITQLDRIDIKTCDMQIHISPTKMDPNKYTCYLNKLFVVQEENILFGGKYDDWMDDDAGEDALPFPLDNKEDDNY